MLCSFSNIMKQKYLHWENKTNILHLRISISQFLIISTNRFLFWSDWGLDPKIERSDLLGNQRRTIVNSKMVKPRGLTLDFESNELLWVDSFKATIESCKLDGGDRKNLHTDEGTNFYGITFSDVGVISYCITSKCYVCPFLKSTCFCFCLANA